jgi:uncharacterized protein DUF2190
MAWQENPRFESKTASANVSALSYTSTDGAVLTYSSGGIQPGIVLVADTATGLPNDVKPASVASVKCVGIAEEFAGPGNPVRVCVGGVTKALAGAAFAIDDTLMVDATGRLVTATAATANFILGRAREAATAAGDLVSVYVEPSEGKVTMP